MAERCILLFEVGRWWALKLRKNLIHISVSQSSTRDCKVPVDHLGGSGLCWALKRGQLRRFGSRKYSWTQPDGETQCRLMEYDVHPSRSSLPLIGIEFSFCSNRRPTSGCWLTYGWTTRLKVKLVTTFHSVAARRERPDCFAAACGSLGVDSFESVGGREDSWSGRVS